MKKSTRIVIVVVITMIGLGGGFLIKGSPEKQKEKALLAQFKSERENHDDALVIIDAIIRLSEELKDYNTYLSQPEKKRLNNKFYFLNTALSCQSIVNSLTEIYNDTDLSNDLFFAAISLEELFNLEVLITNEIETTLDIYNICGTINAEDIKSIKSKRQKNSKDFKAVCKSLSKITFPILQTYKKYLSEPEKESLKKEIYSKFHKSILKLSKKPYALTNSKIPVYYYDVPPFMMYESLRNRTTPF